MVVIYLIIVALVSYVIGAIPLVRSLPRTRRSILRSTEAARLGLPTYYAP